VFETVQYLVERKSDSEYTLLFRYALPWKQEELQDVCFCVE
jgi:hypothetical protein